MARWVFEPGHSAAEFRVRHMMVTWIRGHFSGVRGSMVYDEADPGAASVEVTIDTARLCSGDADRDAHLKAADFLDVEHHPTMTFKSRRVQRTGGDEFRVTGDLTLRGITREVALQVRYQGEWQTPYWEDGVDKGPKRRAGFEATTTINRHDFGVSWQGTMAEGGVVVGDQVHITIDAEAIRED
jgi:polyisoprenoid-binding protein YceI